MMEENKDSKSLPEASFSQLRKSSIRIMAESVVDDNLSSDVIECLAEDTNYRTRTIATSALQYMKHAHRCVLTTDDINSALESSYSVPSIGHSNPSPPFYNHVKGNTASLPESTLFFVPETALDLEKIVTTSESVELPLPQVKLTWGVIAGAACPPCYFYSPSPGMPPSMPATTVVSDELIAYYNTVTKSILSNEETVIKLALSDLQKNPRISPLLPNLVNFVTVGIEKLSHDIKHLTKLLQTIRAIVFNPHLFIGHESYLIPLVQYVFNCVVKFPVSTTANIKLDHHDFKKSAAELLVKIHRDYASPVNALYHTTLRKFEGIFKDLEKPLCYHYGAIIGVMAFGVEAMEMFLYPYMPSYMAHLNTILNDWSYKNALLRADARRVHLMLMNVAIQIIQPCIDLVFSTPETKTSDAPSSNHPQATNAFNDACNAKSEKQHSKHAFEMYKVLYKCFGDRFKNALPLIPTKDVHDPPKIKRVKLYSRATKKEIDDHLSNPCKIDPSESKRNSSDDCFPYDEYENHDYSTHKEFNVENPDSCIKPTIVDTRVVMNDEQRRSSDEQSDCFDSDDRSAHNLGSCDDLQVSELVSDPNSGVKLVIAKRNKNSPKFKQAS